MSAARAHSIALPLALIALTLGCVAYPQRLPGPLTLPEEAPPGDSAGPGPATITAPATITVQRDSDPVWIRRAGERGDSLLPFHRKRERVATGTLVRSGAGGRAEILWSPDATALALFDEGRVTLGDPERDEPSMRFHSVTRALLTLTPEDRVELLGGARLTGDSFATTGPILIEERPGALQRVTNQSKHVVLIGYRDASLELGPGESIDLPYLASGSAPPASPLEAERFEHGGLEFAFVGRLEREDLASGVALRALSETHVSALGVQTTLAEGEAARFSALSLVQDAPAADD